LKAQVSLEALLWLTVAVFMTVAAVLAFAEGLRSAEEMKANMELTSVLTSLFDAMDTLSEVGARIVGVRVPDGISEASVSPDGFGGSVLSFAFRGVNYSHPFPCRVVFASPNPLYGGGEKLLRVEKLGGTVIVSAAGDGND